MNDFIGNNIKFIAAWGQIIMATLIIIGAIGIYAIGKKNRYFLPKGFFGWTGTVFIFLFIILCSLIFARITKVKPGVTAILTQLENLKGNSAPPLTFRLVSNDSVFDIRDYRGKVVLLNYWATWCAPCIKEIPDLNRLHMKYEKDGFAVITISDEERDRLLRYSEKHPLSLVGGYTKTFDWVNLGSERPATFLIDKNGVVRDYFTGPYDFDFFELKISQYLKQ